MGREPRLPIENQFQDQAEELSLFERVEDRVNDAVTEIGARGLFDRHDMREAMGLRILADVHLISEDGLKTHGVDARDGLETLDAIDDVYINVAPRSQKIRNHLINAMVGVFGYGPDKEFEREYYLSGVEATVCEEATDPKNKHHLLAEIHAIGKHLSDATPLKGYKSKFRAAKSAGMRVI